MNRRAFTLLELVAVLLIMAVLAAAVMLVLSRWFVSARLDDAVERVIFMDHLARKASQRGQQALELVFDLDGGWIERRPSSASDEEHGQRHRTSLPRGYRLKRLIVGRESRATRRPVVRFSSQGHAPSYAIEVIGPDGQSTWRVVAGLTGQVTTCASEREVNNVFTQLAL